MVLHMYVGVIDIKSEKNASGDRARFSGSIGYVMTVAGSAVGLGNIWRFPYLAAKYGGGIFLLIYIILTITFGYTMMISETALGRMTGKSPVGAFTTFGKSRWLKIGGWMNALVPMLVVPYYCVVGGWVVRYLFEYFIGNSAELSEDGRFEEIIEGSFASEVCFVIFVLAIFFVIKAGVKNGVEKMSKITMPILIVLAIVIAIYSVTRPGAWKGVKYFLVPDFSKLSFMTFVAAAEQMFFSLSIAMGVLYTYGSYLPKETDIEKSTEQIEIFDSVVALLAGLMIIPAVFAFSGGDMSVLKAGPSLMFVIIPKVFDSMGMSGIIGSVFFIMILFAALTSAIALFESAVSTFEDQLGWNRVHGGLLMLGITMALGTVCVMGSGDWNFISLFGMNMIDFLDFLTNSVMMPVAALFTCVLILAAVGREGVAAEVKLSSGFRREKLYNFVIKYIAPVFLVIILLSAIVNSI